MPNEEAPKGEVPVISISTPPGLAPKASDGGPPDDDDGDGSDKDKPKKEKKSKKDKKRKDKKRKNKKRHSSSSSSSSSDSSQVGKQMLKALMKQLKKSSKKDKKSEDEGTDGERPKNQAKEAEKIRFPKFPLPLPISPTWLLIGSLRFGTKRPTKSNFATRKSSLLSMQRSCPPSRMCWKVISLAKWTPSKRGKRTPGGLFGEGRFRPS